MNYSLHQKGFTLLELLLTITMLAILIGVSLPAYFTLFPVNDLDVAKNQVAQSLGRAAFLSSASDGDSNWGVEILSGSVVIFKGTTYNPGDAYNEVYPIASSITPSGLSQIVFNKMTGFPQTTGTVTLTSTSGNTRTIIINAKGTVSY